MGILSKFFNNTPQANATQQQNFVGAPSFAQINPGKWYNHYKSDEYSSAYPNIRAIVDEYISEVRIKAVDGNGKTIQDHNIVNALHRPNQVDDIVSFTERLLVSRAVHRNTYILVWRNENGEAKPGGPYGYKGQNIAGFTFLEGVSLTRRDNKTYYNIGSQYFTEDEVIVIPGGVNPHNLYEGYSATEASIRWIRLDDLIADFQRGFFENNAISAGMFVVTAPSVKEYDDIVDMLQSRHRGAGNNNNVTYSHRPVDPNNGKPTEAQIEWIPFSQSQKDIDFAAVFDQANKRIDMSFGVSQIIKGVDDQAKYSNADVSERGFAKRVVKPIAIKVTTRITHELNRITGGFGAAITFDYEIPEVSDKKKVEAEVVRVDSDTILKMTEEGYSLDSIVDAFKMPIHYKLLKKNDQASAKIENDKPQVDEGGEVESSPDPDKIDGVTPLNKEAAKGKNPKAQLTDLEQFEAVAREYMQKRVDRAVREYDESIDAAEETSEEDDLEAFIAAALALAILLMLATGESQYKDGKTLVKDAGFNTDNSDKYILSDSAKEEYQAHLRRVGNSYDSETRDSIRKVLEQANSGGWSESQTRDALKNVMNTDEYRVNRLARSETNRSESLADVDAMKQLASETGAEIEKTVAHPGGANCDLCKSMEGIWKPVAQPMLALGESVETSEGVIFVNNYEDNQGHDYHPNGNGRPQFRIVNASQS